MSVSGAIRLSWCRCASHELTAVRSKWRRSRTGLRPTNASSMRHNVSRPPLLSCRGRSGRTVQMVARRCRAGTVVHMDMNSQRTDRGSAARDHNDSLLSPELLAVRGKLHAGASIIFMMDIENDSSFQAGWVASYKKFRELIFEVFAAEERLARAVQELRNESRNDCAICSASDRSV